MKAKKSLAVIIAATIFISEINIGFNKTNPISKAKEKVDDFIVMSTGTTDLEKITEDFPDSEQVINDENIVDCEMTESEARKL